MLISSRCDRQDGGSNRLDKVLTNFLECFFEKLTSIFQDWWNDFDLQTYSKDFTRQISNEAPKRTMLDNFFDLKMGRDLDTSLTSSN